MLTFNFMKSPQVGKKCLRNFVNWAKRFYEQHSSLVITSILLAVLLAVIFTYLLDNSLPNGFSSGDLSGNLESFFGNNYLLKTWGTFYPPWNIFYSMPNFGLNIFSVFHYFFFLILNGNIIYTYKLYTIFEIFSCGLFMFFVTFKLTKRGFGSILAALFYALTPYFLGELVSHIYFIWSYILLPPACYLIYKALTVKSVKIAIITGATAAVATIFAYLENVYVVGLFLLVFALLVTFFYSNTRSTKIFVKSILSKIGLIAIMVLTYIFLSFYLIFPSFTFNTILAGANPSHRFTEAIILSNSFLKAFSLADFGQPTMLIVTLLSIFSIILPLIERKKLYYILSIVGLLSLVLTVGPNIPVFTYAFKYLPLFNLIRVPIRFSITTCFVFSLMGGISLDIILKKLKTTYSNSTKHLPRLSFKKNLIVAIMILLILFPVAYVVSEYNFAYSKVGPLVHSESQSGLDSTSSYLQVEQFLNQADPSHQYRVFDMVSSNGEIFSFDHKTTGYFIPLDLVFTAYHSSSFAKILSLYGVKFIVSIADSAAIIGFAGNYQVSYSDFNNALSNSPDFEKAYQVNDIVVYENLVTQPLIYPAYGALTVGGPQALSLFYSLNLSQNWALMFSNQVINKTFNLQSLEDYNAIVFHDQDIRDIAIQQMDNFTQPWASIDIYNSRGWTLQRTSPFPIDHPFFNVQNSMNGQIAYSHFFAFTQDKTSLKIPISIEQSGNFSIWTRVLKSHGNGLVTVTLDSNKTTTTDFTGVYGFTWIKTDTYNLEKGVHYLTVTNDDLTPLYLDVITPISENELVTQINNLSSILGESNLPTLYLLEFSQQFSGENAHPINNADFSSNESLLMEPNATVKTNLYVADRGNYTIGLKLLAPSGKLELSIDNQTIYDGSLRPNGETNWTLINTDTVALNAGDHTIQVKNSEGNSILDFMYIAAITTNSNSSDSWAGTKFGEKNSLGNVSFTQTGVNDWTGNIKLNQQAFLVFPESFYGDSWSLSIGNKNQLQYPLPTSYVFNAFPINTLETQSFRIFYTQSNLIAVSNLISIITFVVVCVVAFLAYFRKPKHGAKSDTQDIETIQLNRKRADFN
jgi:hypothetical protein